MHALPSVLQNNSYNSFCNGQKDGQTDQLAFNCNNPPMLSLNHLGQRNIPLSFMRTIGREGKPPQEWKKDSLPLPPSISFDMLDNAVDRNL